jgi:hypothetical protein
MTRYLEAVIEITRTLGLQKGQTQAVTFSRALVYLRAPTKQLGLGLRIRLVRVNDGVRDRLSK